MVVTVVFLPCRNVKHRNMGKHALGGHSFHPRIRGVEGGEDGIVGEGGK